MLFIYKDSLHIIRQNVTQINKEREQEDKIRRI